MLHGTLPAMSVRCTMTCPPTHLPLVGPDCCFFVERSDLKPKSPVRTRLFRALAAGERPFEPAQQDTWSLRCGRERCSPLSVPVRVKSRSKFRVTVCHLEPLDNHR